MDVQAPAFRPRLSGVLAVILEGAAAVFFCVCLPVSFVVCVCVCEIYTCLEYIYTHIFFFVLWLVTMTPGWHRESFLWRVLSLSCFVVTPGWAPGVFFVEIVITHLFFFVLVYYIIESYLYLNYNFSHSSDLIR
jgi:hypothetical protein